MKHLRPMSCNTIGIMKLIKFTRDYDFGQDFYVQILFNEERALFQGSIHWSEYAMWPYFGIKLGSGGLISIRFNVYKFGLGIALFERTWKLEYINYG